MMSKEIYLPVRVKCVTYNTLGCKQQNIQVRWLIQIGTNFSFSFPFSKREVNSYRTLGISSPRTLGLISPLALAFLVLPLYKVATRDPSMIIKLQQKQTRIIYYAFVRKQKLSQKLPKDFHLHLISQIYHIATLPFKGNGKKSVFACLAPIVQSSKNKKNPKNKNPVGNHYQISQPNLPAIIKKFILKNVRDFKITHI